MVSYPTTDPFELWRNRWKRGYDSTDLTKIAGRTPPEHMLKSQRPPLRKPATVFVGRGRKEHSRPQTHVPQLRSPRGVRPECPSVAPHGTNAELLRTMEEKRRRHNTFPVSGGVGGLGISKIANRCSIGKGRRQLPIRALLVALRARKAPPPPPPPPDLIGQIGHRGASIPRLVEVLENPSRMRISPGKTWILGEFGPLLF